MCLLNLIFSWWYWHPICIYPWNVNSHLSSEYVCFTFQAWIEKANRCESSCHSSRTYILQSRRCLNPWTFWLSPAHLWVWGHGSRKKGRRFTILVLPECTPANKKSKAPYNNPSVNEFVRRPMLPEYRKKSDSPRPRWRKKDVAYFLSMEF